MRFRAVIDDENFYFEVESNDDDTEIALIVHSITGKKISIEEFLEQIEDYVSLVRKAEAQRRESGAPDH